jgi:hypothetical protein
MSLRAAAAVYCCVLLLLSTAACCCCCLLLLSTAAACCVLLSTSAVYCCCCRRDSRVMCGLCTTARLGPCCLLQPLFCFPIHRVFTRLRRPCPVFPQVRVWLLQRRPTPREHPGDQSRGRYRVRNAARRPCVCKVHPGWHGRGRGRGLRLVFRQHTRASESRGVC